MMPAIYGTLGPRCADADTLCAMLEAGMTGMRLNLSHSSLRDAAGEIESLHRAAAKCGVKVQLLIDMQGPELRIGALSAPLSLAVGASVPFGEGGIPVPSLVLSCLTPGQEVLLDDGKRLLSVVEAGEKRALGRVLRGGTLTGHKSIALPGSALHPPTLTEMDRENIALAPAYGVTGLMQPFVRDRADLEAVRAALDAAGGRDIRLFAKVESREGVENVFVETWRMR